MQFVLAKQRIDEGGLNENQVYGYHCALGEVTRLRGAGLELEKRLILAEEKSREAAGSSAARIDS